MTVTHTQCSPGQRQAQGHELRSWCGVKCQAEDHVLRSKCKVSSSIPSVKVQVYTQYSCMHGLWEQRKNKLIPRITFSESANIFPGYNNN